MVAPTLSLALLSLLAPGMQAKSGCGSIESPPEVLEAAKGIDLTGPPADLAIRRRAYRHEEGLVIPTYLHVVEGTDAVGYVTEDMIAAQVCVIEIPC